MNQQINKSINKYAHDNNNNNNNNVVGLEAKQRNNHSI